MYNKNVLLYPPLNGIIISTGVKQMDVLKESESVEETDKKSGISGNMLDLRGVELQTPLQSLSLENIVFQLSKSQREKLISGYDLKKFAKVFEDGGMMLTAETFLKSGMNVSETARKLYMHRNTLIYRLNSIRKKTGLDLRDFDMAVTFKLLHILYSMK